MEDFICLSNLKIGSDSSLKEIEGKEYNLRIHCNFIKEIDISKCRIETGHEDPFVEMLKIDNPPLLKDLLHWNHYEHSESLKKITRIDIKF